MTSHRPLPNSSGGTRDEGYGWPIPEERALSTATIPSSFETVARALETSRPMIAVRPDPNFAETWALAASVPLFWIIANAIPIMLLAALFTPIGLVLARLDAERCERVFGERFASPLLAIPTPLLYLAFRLLRDQNLRAGRPLWTAVAVSAVVLFFTTVANISAYAMWVHGW